MNIKIKTLILSLVVIGSSVHASTLKDLSSGNIRPASTDKMIALTFDDGPTPRTTRAVLKVLKQYNIPATFFVIGRQAAAYPQIVESAFNDGHIIANHSYSHKYISKVSWFRFKKTVKSEFFKAHDIITPYLGNGENYYFRAPGASWKERASKIINKTDIGKKYIGPVLWDVGGSTFTNNSGEYTSAADWECWSKKISVNSCLQGYLNRTSHTNGGIVLMHDLNMKTVDLLKKYIPALLERGYTFVTLDDMDLKK